MLTLQTEVGGDPLTVTTIVVNRGRTVKVFRDLVTELQETDPGLLLTDFVTRAHQRVVGRLKVPTRLSSATPPPENAPTQPTNERKAIARAEDTTAAKGPSDADAAINTINTINTIDTIDRRKVRDAKDAKDAEEAAGEAASLLVIKAVEAFDRLDHRAALNLLEAALSMLPGDPRIQRSIARLRELV